MVPRRTGQTGIFAWIFLALAVAGCGGAPEPPALSATRGYVLISIDTLRADHLGCYGYGRDTSPFLDSLAARGALFENAYVQLPGTLPSHMSIFTGLYPAEHGVFPPAGVLSPEIETLPEVFRRHGFRTAGHAEGGYVHGGYGFARGFEEWSHEARKIETDVERTLERGLAFLRRLGEDERFLLFLHTYAVHDPYFPATEYLERFWQGPPPETFPATGPEFAAFNRGERQISDRALEFYRAAYDASIRYVDDVLASFFAELGDLGLDDQVTVVLTSDHGEELLEHGRMVHTQIYPETLRVPLLVLHPEIAGPRRVPAVVESIDIAPTLYRLAGIEPRASISGRSFVPLLAGGHWQEKPEAFAERQDRQARALIQRRDGALYQLFLEQPDAGPRWLTSGVAFDTFATELELEARSYHAPRRMRIEADGEPVTSAELDPERWIKVRAPLNRGAGKKRITLESDTCSVPAEVADSEDRRCLAFMVRGVPMLRLELYDLAADPLAASDLSREEPAVVRRMMGRFEDYELEPRSAAEARDLDPELEERLKALGYLQ